MIYNYMCNNCKNSFELEIPISYYIQDGFIPVCCHCMSDNVKRVIIPINVIYKDSGFTKHTEGEE